MYNSYCIYVHINKINNKKYVGKTKYGDEPEKRWGINGNNYRYTKLFWPDIQKYGWDNFEHVILESNLTYKKAIEKEVEYTLKFKSFEKEHGYNIRIGNSNVTNELKKQNFSIKYFSEEEKKKRKKLRMRRKMKKYNDINNKKRSEKFKQLKLEKIARENEQVSYLLKQGFNQVEVASKTGFSLSKVKAIIKRMK